MSSFAAIATVLLYSLSLEKPVDLENYISYTGPRFSMGGESIQAEMLKVCITFTHAILVTLSSTI
jgi:hypothetical protein